MDSRLIVGLCFLLFLTGTSVRAFAEDSDSHSKVPPKLVEEGIVFHEVDGFQLKLDMATPTKGDGPWPLLIYVHGGGWKEGSRGAYRGQIEEAAQRGYVAVTMSHRLTAERNEKGKVKYPWPAAIHDVKACIRFLRSHAKDYRIDPNRFGITGASSGGHLSLLAGVTDAEDGLEGTKETTVSTRVQAVVNIAGPTDMAKVYDVPVVTPYARDFLGGSPTKLPKAYLKSSPIHYYDKTDPPILTIHSKQDTIVPVEQALMLDAKARKIGTVHELKLIDEPENHQPRSHNLSELYAQKLALEFFDRVLKER